MNAYNKRRVENAISDIKHHKEELLACAVAEESAFQRESNSTLDNSEICSVFERASSLWEAIECLKQACELLEVVINPQEN